MYLPNLTSSGWLGKGELGQNYLMYVLSSACCSAQQAPAVF